MAKKESEILTEIKGWGVREYIILLGCVVITALIVLGLFYNDNKEMEKLGKEVCKEYNYTYWYVSGNTVHCYTTDYQTGFKIPYDFWIDVDLAKQIYLENETD